jgi:hypothetical protein
VLVELLVLRWWLPRSGSPLRLVELMPNLLAGAALLLALRLALADADWWWLALALTTALIAHLADLQSRWKRNHTGNKS